MRAQIATDALPEGFPLGIMKSLYSQGCWLLPLGGGDGKKPLVRAPQTNRLPFNLVVSKMLDANSKTYGLVTRGFTVFDSDTDNQATADYVKRMFGDSTLQIVTPRGRHHYFRGDYGSSKNLINDGQIVIDVKAGARSYVVAPGSIRPDNGKYSIDTCNRLYVADDNNIIRTLPPFLCRRETESIPKSPSSNSLVPVGSRTVEFIKPRIVELAKLVSSEEDLFQQIRTEANKQCADPETISDSDLRSWAKWAWGKRLDNKLYGGNHSAVQIPRAVMLVLDQFRSQDALRLYCELWHAHGAKPGKRFAIATHAMHDAATLTHSNGQAWPEKRIRNAKNNLLKAGCISVVESAYGKKAARYMLHKIL